MICGILSLLFLGSAAPLIWAWREMRRETKLAMVVLERAAAIEARAMRVMYRADERYAEARKLRDQWKFAKIISDAETGRPKVAPESPPEKKP